MVKKTSSKRGPKPKLASFANRTVTPVKAKKTAARASAPAKARSLRKLVGPPGPQGPAGDLNPELPALLISIVQISKLVYESVQLQLEMTKASFLDAWKFHYMSMLQAGKVPQAEKYYEVYKIQADLLKLDAKALNEYIPEDMRYTEETPEAAEPEVAVPEPAPTEETGVVQVGLGIL